MDNQLLNNQIIDLIKKSNDIINTLQEQNKTWERIKESDQWLDMQSVSKTLNYKNIGRNKLFSILRENNILNEDNKPYQRYVNQGLFKITVKPREKSYNNQPVFDTVTTVSAKGVDYINKIIEAGNYAK